MADFSVTEIKERKAEKRDFGKMLYRNSLEL